MSLITCGVRFEWGEEREVSLNRTAHHLTAQSSNVRGLGFATRVSSHRPEIRHIPFTYLEVGHARDVRVRGEIEVLLGIDDTLCGWWRGEVRGSAWVRDAGNLRHRQ